LVFQKLLFVEWVNLYRYDSGLMLLRKAEEEVKNFDQGGAAADPRALNREVGRCTLTSSDPQLKGAWFQTLHHLSSEKPVS
jgi:hypothetical protein